MNQERISDHRSQNLLHSVLLLGGMVLLLVWIGEIFFGTPGVTLAVVAGAALLTLGRVKPDWVLRMQRAQRLEPHQAPALHRIIHELTRRAELRNVPQLYLVPSPTLNAFAVGNGEASAIGVTRGLLQTLDQRELTGVLAHEISHIKHRDLWVMGLAQLIGRMTRSLSWLGQLILFLSIPAVLMGSYQIPLGALLMLIAAPTLSSLLLLALSRTREFAADLGAARLTGDPMGLASALHRLDARQGAWWRMLFPTVRRTTSFLDSHPATAERIARLKSLVSRPDVRQTAARRPSPEPRPTAQRRPRRVPVRLTDHGPVPWPVSTANRRRPSRPHPYARYGFEVRPLVA